MTDGKACPATGGAHRFIEDENGVRICPCGEVEISIDDELMLAEVAHDATYGPLKPRLDRRRLVEKIAETLAKIGEPVSNGWVEEVLDAQEDDWIARQRQLDREENPPNE